MYREHARQLLYAYAAEVIEFEKEEIISEYINTDLIVNIHHDIQNSNSRISTLADNTKDSIDQLKRVTSFRWMVIANVTAWIVVVFVSLVDKI